ncbi:MAG: VanZ family protein [Oscillospiraceae bacterium]|nr:VanZ family protein [Oscillospiraceae bacterium]
MIRTDKRLRICFVWLVLNLCFIWGNSMLPGEISGALSDWVKSILEALLPGDGMQSSGGGFLRKLAHFTEFMSLGMCLLWLFSMLETHSFFALLCGAGVACVDETIQMFVPDRGPSLFDVGIDTCGVMTGMMLLQIGYYLWRRK